MVRASSSSSSSAPVPARPRPNLLIVTVDTLRTDRLSCYDPAHVDTPAIDRLAASGVRFERAFAHTPTTLPSHANIFLGVTPPVHGVHDNLNFTVSDDLLTLAEHLQTAGWSTAAFVGGYPVSSRFGLAQGFDIYDDRFDTTETPESGFRERPAEAVVAAALEWLVRAPEPWFMWVHVFDPHDPYVPPEPFRSRFAGRPYDGEVAYVDAALAPLLERLGTAEADAGAVIVLTADHGESLGEHGEETHGYFAYNSTLHVPLIFRAPGVAPGRVVERRVGHIDIFPTVCSLLGVRAPSGLQGRSIVPLLRGRSLRIVDHYFESLYPFYSRSWAPLRGIIRGDTKFIDSPMPELYDLARDFGETKNLIRVPDVAQWQAALTGLLSPRSKRPEVERRRPDREAFEKLRSLGYVGGAAAPDRNRVFGPNDDAKALLPFHNRAVAAARHYAEGNASRAVAELAAILAEREDVDIAYTTMAILYKDLGRIDDALDVLARGLAVFPGHYELFSTRVKVLMTAGRYADVIALVSGEAPPEAANDPDIWNDVGVAALRTADLERARDAFEHALALDADYALVHYNFGLYYQEAARATGDGRMLARSLASHKKALEIDPGYAAAYNGLGTTYLQAGNLDEAAVCFEQALEHAPDYSTPLFNLGLARFMDGRKDEALALFERFRERQGANLVPGERARLDELIRQCRAK